MIALEFIAVVLGGPACWLECSPEISAPSCFSPSCPVFPRRTAGVPLMNRAQGYHVRTTVLTALAIGVAIWAVLGPPPGQHLTSFRTKLLVAGPI